MPVRFSVSRSLVRVVVVALTCGVALLGLFAASASSHILSTASALGLANRHAQRLVNEGTYVAKTVQCSRNYPHVFTCILAFDTVASRPTSTYACQERIIVLYDNHDDYVVGYRHYNVNAVCD